MVALVAASKKQAESNQYFDTEFLALKDPESALDHFVNILLNTNICL